MAFEKFEIPPKSPTKESRNGGYRCNRRIRIEGKEEYCTQTVKEKRRCAEHDVGARLVAAREEARLERIIDPSTVEERVTKLIEDKRNLTRLDGLILTSLATIEELEKRYPLTTIEPDEAFTISRMKEKHSDLVQTRIDIELKLKVLMDANFIFDKASELFEQNITDKNTQKTLLEGIGIILDECVRTGNTQPLDKLV